MRTLSVILFFLMTSTVMAGEVTLVVDDKTIEGGDYFKIIEPVWWSVSIYEGPAVYEKDLAGFSRQQRHVFACAWYIAEVNNGGHGQFYDNSTGIVWKDAMEGFDAMGAKQVADIIRESAKRMGGKPGMVREERWKQLERKEADFDDLDDRFYELDEEINLDRKIIAYIKRNREKFYFSGKVEKP